MNQRCAVRGMRRRLIPGLALCALSVLGGCAPFFAPPRVQVLEPTSVRPTTPSQAAVQPTGNGAIYRPEAHRPLFEDRRARLVGDILTVSLQEKTSAKQSSASSLDRQGKLDASVAAMPLLKPGASILGKLSGSGESANSMSGKGDTASDNTFTGTITVTVLEVLPNGNLVVSGEKQIGINQNADTLRFSGVVNPATILAGNVVSSTQIADARLQVRGTGDIDRAQTGGWLSRFFLSWSPI